MATPIISPLVPTYASREPYLTSAEYLASPTGVDVSSLVPGGSLNDQADALAQTIARASSTVDVICRKVLAATIDTQAGMYRIRSDGTIRIKLDYTPIVQVNDVQTGLIVGQLTSLTDLSGVWIDRKVITVPVVPVSYRWGASGRMYAVTTYVNGYANSILTANAAQGAATITLDSVLGIVPGLPMTVYDPGASEQVIAQSVTGNAVTLAAPLASAHAAGVAVSALPPHVKQATVLLTSALIKTRGDDSFVMPELGAQATGYDATISKGPEEFQLAAELLQTEIRVA